MSGYRIKLKIWINPKCETTSKNLTLRKCDWLVDWVNFLQRNCIFMVKSEVFWMIWEIYLISGPKVGSVQVAVNFEDPKFSVQRYERKHLRNSKSASKSSLERHKGFSFQVPHWRLKYNSDFKYSILICVTIFWTKMGSLIWSLLVHKSYDV